jgi:hypothetical protein
LIGKEIVFIDLNYLGSGITIATKDCAIIQLEYDEDEYYTVREEQAYTDIMTSNLLLDSLKEKGIITNQEIQKYAEEQQRKAQRFHEQLLKEKEEHEYKEYLRLKEKYEGGK